LENALPGNSMMFSSKGCEHAGQIRAGNLAREYVKANFDPSYPSPRNDFRVLITTDVLSEGMNLHRAGRIINYDLPWNPTRVMQRLGRVNRVGTEYNTICLFNFFPTAQADAHLGLEANIVKKIDAFNTVLGNDNRFLTGEENPDPHGLFGERLLKRFSSLPDDEDDEDSELKYLQIIRKVRDDDAALFEQVKSLPVKARSGHDKSSEQDSLLVFFREGALKKFVLAGQNTRELTFLEAAPLMSCNPGEPRAALPKDYYKRLKAARSCLEQVDEDFASDSSVTPSVRKLLETIRALQRHSSMTDVDQDYLQRLYEAIEQSAIARRTITNIQNTCKRKELGPVNLLNALRKLVPPVTLEEAPQNLEARDSSKYAPKQIILAQFLAPKAETL
jgi:superfamily II DNA/RNA helicase